MLLAVVQTAVAPLLRQCSTIIVASEQGWIPALSLYILRVTLQNLMMNIELPPDLHLEVRKIQNIEIWSDLLPLIAGRQKIPSIPLNAYGAQLQDQIA